MKSLVEDLGPTIQFQVKLERYNPFTGDDRQIIEISHFIK
jgi:hypothetical protein